MTAVVGSIELSVIAQLRDGIDLVGLVGADVDLERAGKDFRACCPFHEERTPSFYVVPAKHFWFCHGCGETGDAIDWLVRRRGLRFLDAVRWLANTQGVSLNGMTYSDESYDPEAMRAAWEAEVAERRRHEREELQRGRDQAAAVAAERFGKADPSWSSHPYAARKKIGASDAVRLEGNLLLIAARDVETTTIITLQTIAPDGTKRFLPGGRTKGTRAAFGSPAATKAAKEGTAPVFIAEGVATAASVWEATGHVALAAFSAGNLRTIAEGIRKKYPLAKVILVADNDRWSATPHGRNPGLLAAIEAARAVGGLVVLPQFTVGCTNAICAKNCGQDHPTDANDLFVAEGRDAVLKCVAAACPPESEVFVRETASPTRVEAPESPSKTPSAMGTALHTGSDNTGKTATATESSSAEDDPQQFDLTADDFHAYMPLHRFLFTASGELWPASSVDSRVPWMPLTDEEGHPQLDRSGNPKKQRPSAWIAKHRAVEQMTWAPGEPQLIEGRLISDGGWIERAGCRTFNLYRPPTIDPGDPAKAGPWLEHAHKVLPQDEAEYVIRWLAHKRQRPHVKINHALALQGPQGAGKDTIIEGAIPSFGEWNVKDVSPEKIMGRFNPWLKSILLRVSEARDLGDFDRYRLYEHLKTIIAAPPSVLQVDEKNLREHCVPNITGVVITSNHPDGIYLPPDDRRHYVARTELTKDDFPPDYFRKLYAWYETGGYRHIAAFLATLDLSGFDPKAPPPKTAGWWALVDAGRAPEDAELADIVDRLMQPAAVTLQELADHAETGFGDWLRDRKNSRQIPHRLSAVGYIACRNDGAKDGKWKVRGRRQVIYVRQELVLRDRFEAARTLAEARR